MDSSSHNSMSVGEPCRARRSLFQEAEEFLVHSHILFLYADLRVLSATGRLHTKFETLFVESDKQLRTSASDLSGTNQSIGNKHLLGISPAQIMAILIIEIRKEVQKSRKKKGMETEKSFLSILSENSTRKKYEDNMAGCLLTYNRVIGRDMKKKIDTKDVLNGAPEKDTTSLTQMTKMNSEPKLFSLRTQVPKYSLGFLQKNKNDHVTRETLNDGQSEWNETKIDIVPPSCLAAGQKNKKKIVSFGNKTSNDLDTQPSRMQMLLNSHFRKGNEPPFENGIDEESTDSYLNETPISIMSQALRRGFPYGPEAQEFVLREESQIVGDAFFDLTRAGFVEDVDKNMTEEDLLDMIQTAVESREDHSLDFMKGFFKEESMSEAMFKSKANVFWINDWYPLIDCTYAIAVDEDERRVLVVFRGAKTSADWEHSRSSKFVKVPNPIKEDFKGKKKTVSLHSGFYNYLFRKRKDTGTTKFDEIANKVQEYVTMLGGDCEIVITGFSLGGALATTFAFYGSADERLTLTKPIKMYTYGSPFVGGPSFAVSFQHQEQQKRIMYARVVNSNDLVTNLPVSYKGNYQHVGLALTLPHLRGCIRKQLFGQPYPTLNYSKSYDFATRYCRAVRENFFLNMSYPWLIRKRHSLDEHHKRMVYFEENNSEKGLLTESSIEDLYEKIVLA